MIANTVAQPIHRRQPDERQHTLPRVVVRMQTITTPRPQMQPTVYRPSLQAHIDLAPDTGR